MVLRALFQSSSVNLTFSVGDSEIFGAEWRSGDIRLTQMKFSNSSKNPKIRLKVVMESAGLTKATTIEKSKEDRAGEHFKKMKQRFLGFKRDKYLSDVEHYTRLSEAQSPKFMLIACADSRVCPSAILGFEPGEAFAIRNVANLVPPHENGPSETNAALEFAVNSLEVENILVVGHSRCGGIQALMSMQDEANPSSFIASWVRVAKPARLNTRAAASGLEFDQQCKHCEKESINRSMQNLLTYPWIEERVKQGKLSIHGGYYDFVDCSFEKWTLDLSDDHLSTKNREVWT